MRADFHGVAKARITSLFNVVANKMNLPTNVPLGLMMQSGGAAAQPVSPGNTSLSEDQVKIKIEQDAHIVLDSDEYNLDPNTGLETHEPLEPPDLMLSLPPSLGSSSEASSTLHQGSAAAQPSRPSSTRPPPRKRKRRGSLDDFGEWIIRKGQWRLLVQPRTDTKSGMEIVLVAVKLDALSGQKGRNMVRGFLS